MLALCWPMLGLSWPYVGPMLAYLGPMLAYVGPMLAHLGAYVGASSAVFLAIYVAAMLKHLQEPNLSDFFPSLEPKAT